MGGAEVERGQFLPSNSLPDEYELGFGIVLKIEELHF